MARHYAAAFFFLGWRKRINPWRSGTLFPDHMTEVGRGLKRNRLIIGILLAMGVCCLLGCLSAPAGPDSWSLPQGRQFHCQRAIEGSLSTAQRTLLLEKIFSYYQSEGRLEFDDGTVCIASGSSRLLNPAPDLPTNLQVAIRCDRQADMTYIYLGSPTLAPDSYCTGGKHGADHY